MEAEQEGDLNITVARYQRLAACPGFTDDELKRLQLPDGFPMIVDRTSGEIVEPVFRYLYARTVMVGGGRGVSKDGRSRRLTLESASAAADNLRLWWGYLRFTGQAWDGITAIDLTRYNMGLSRAISPRTGDRLTTGTLRQRMTHVLEFYRWSNRLDLTAVDPAALLAGENQVEGRDSSSRVSALTYEEWEKVRTIVGPLPSEAAANPALGPSRDRLQTEVMIHTGMRLKEVCGLTVHQFRALEARMSPDLGPFAARSTRLTIVKGGPRRARDAIVPNWLLLEILAYVDGPERAEAVKVYASRHKGREPNALFLNHAFAQRSPGEPVKRKRVEARFTEVMYAAGLVDTISVTDPDTGETHLKEQARHSVHHLRHTAAVWRYMAERAAGNLNPWHPVMVMLGHAHEKTTRQIYLRVTNEFEAAVSDASMRFFRALQPLGLDS